MYHNTKETDGYIPMLCTCGCFPVLNLLCILPILWVVADKNSYIKAHPGQKIIDYLCTAIMMVVNTTWIVALIINP